MLDAYSLERGAADRGILLHPLGSPLEIGMASVQKELKEIIRSAENQGWRVERTKKGHYKFYAPDGVNIVVSGGTPSDRRALDNLVAQLRRYGFNWKGR